MSRKGRMLLRFSEMGDSPEQSNNVVMHLVRRFALFLVKSRNPDQFRLGVNAMPKWFLCRIYPRCQDIRVNRDQYGFVDNVRIGSRVFKVGDLICIKDIGEMT